MFFIFGVRLGDKEGECGEGFGCDFGAEIGADFGEKSDERECASGLIAVVEGVIFHYKI